VTGARYWSTVETAWGFVALVGGKRGLSYAGFPEATENEALAILHADSGALGELVPNAFEEVAARLRAYFDGRRVDWSDLAVDLEGTAFHLSVWQATRSIGYGETATYAEVAGLVGRPRAARGAGAALAANRAGLLVPCHRVVAANGIGGYGARPERKRALLDLEARGVANGSLAALGPARR
jgi:O-6-methylguanine DNA methyltransferase